MGEPVALFVDAGQFTEEGLAGINAESSTAVHCGGHIGKAFDHVQQFDRRVQALSVPGCMVTDARGQVGTIDTGENAHGGSLSG